MKVRTQMVLRGIVLLVLVVGIVGIAYGQNESGDMMEPAQTNVSYEGPNGVQLQGYLAEPSGSGPFPAVLMVHEWWGLNKDTARLANALSREGYVVLAADAFRGSVAQSPSKAMEQVRGTPSEQIAADLDAALEYLKSRSDVDSSRVASLGFCFGGTQSMYMGTRRGDLAAVVIFYGGGPITDANELGSMRQAAPVLGIYGEQDNNIPTEEVRQFEAALESRNVEHQIEIYPGVGHAFVKSDSYDDGGTAQEAWNRMLGFLNRNL
jgi:carboxymethylenebutenolidase